MKASAPNLVFKDWNLRFCSIIWWFPSHDCCSPFLRAAGDVPPQIWHRPPFYPLIPCGFYLIWIADLPGKPGAGPGTHKIDSLVAAYLSPKRWRQRRDSDGNDFQRLPTDFKGSKGRRKGWRRHSLLSKAMQVIRIWITRTGFPGS